MTYFFKPPQFQSLKTVKLLEQSKCTGYLLRPVKVLFFTLLFFISSNTFSQTFPPATSCTSKDLLLVNATLPYVPCEACTGTTVTKPLTLYINNKTGSTRTSFAFWANLTVYNSDGSVDPILSMPISKCFSTIPKNATTPYLYGNITIGCGQSVALTDIWEAWTDASPNSTCPTLLDATSTINPKCGTVASLNVVAGADAIYTPTPATCTTLGSIKAEPFGGTAPYTVKLYDAAGTTLLATSSSIAAGGFYTFSNLAAATYTLKLTDANNCNPPASKPRTVLATGSVSTPTISSVAATCSAAGSSTISNYSASNTYAFTPSGPSVGAGGSISGMVIGTSYTVTSSNGSCTSPASASFSNAAMLATPAIPTITSILPTCSADGSSTINNYSAANTYAFTPSGPSVGAGGLISGMTIGTSYTVTSNNGSCTSPASASFSNAAMLITPATPTISSTPATCSAAGSSTISNYSASNTYAFTPSGPSVGAGGQISGMTIGTSYTVTSNNGSCTSPASASFSNAAMLITPATPTISSAPATCSATGSSTINNYSASNTYAFTPSGPSVGAGGLIIGMTIGTSYTVTSNNVSCTSPASASFSNAAMLITPATPTIGSTPATCSAAGSSTISNYSASNTYAFTPSGPTVGAGGLISGMTIGTSYTVTSNNGSCTSPASASFSNAATLITPATPTISSAPATCSAAGSSTISNYSASNTYAFTPSGPSVGAGGLISGMTIGTSYTVTSNNGSCTSPVSASFSNAAMLITPATPTISSAPATCSATGSSTINNYSASNTYAFTPSGPSVGAGGLISGMAIGTSYTVTSNNGSCTSPASASFSNAAMLITPATPTISSTPATCSAAGSSTINNYSASNTYAFTPSGPSVGAGGSISGMIIGTSYTVTSDNGSCTSPASASFSNAANLAGPTFTVCIVQPTLCSTGSLTINASGGSGFTYSIDGVDFSNTTGVFSNLGAASVSTIQVKNSDGCSSAPVSCGEISSQCGEAPQSSIVSNETPATEEKIVTQPTVASSEQITLVGKISNKETTVKAYPNPFSDKVRFVVTSPLTGRGSLDVYNTLGQKVTTVYSGLISAGSQIFEMSLPVRQVSNLTYILRIEDKKISGKIMQINR